MAAVAVLLAAAVAATALGAESRASSAPPVRSAPLALNRRTFGGNVAADGHAPHWVVLFCVDWLGPCEELRSAFRGLGVRHEKRLNTGALLAPVARFAEVDCATDKALCNEQLVDGYPTVVHYRRGDRLGVWSGGNGAARDEGRKLARWIESELGPGRDTPREVQAPAVARTSSKGPAQLALTLLALVAFAVAGASELRRAARVLQNTFQPREEAPKQASGAAGAATERDSPATRLSRCLPKEWATQRGSIVL